MTSHRPESKAKQPVNFRVEPDVKERIARNAATPPFSGNESLFVRYALDLVMDLREAHGPGFDLVVAGLRRTSDVEEKEPFAA